MCSLPQKRARLRSTCADPAKRPLSPAFLSTGAQGALAGETGKGATAHQHPAARGPTRGKRGGRDGIHDPARARVGWRLGGLLGGVGVVSPPPLSIYARRGAAKGRKLYIAALAAGYRARRGAAWRNRANKLIDKTDQRSVSLGAARKRLLPGDWSPGT